MAIFGKRKDKNAASDAAQQSQQGQAQQQSQHHQSGSSNIGSGGHNSLELGRAPGSPNSGAVAGGGSGSIGLQGMNNFGSMMANGAQGGPGGPPGQYSSLGAGFLPSQALHQQQAQQAQAVAQGAAAAAGVAGSNGPMSIPMHGSPASSLNSAHLQRNNGPGAGGPQVGLPNGGPQGPGGPGQYRGPGMNGTLPGSGVGVRSRKISTEGGANGQSALMQPAGSQAVMGQAAYGGIGNGAPQTQGILMQPGSSIGSVGAVDMNAQQQGPGMMGPGAGAPAGMSAFASMASPPPGASSILAGGNGVGSNGIDGLPHSSAPGAGLSGGTLPPGAGQVQGGPSGPVQGPPGGERTTRAPNVVFPWSQRPLNLLPPRFLDERQQAPPGALSPSPFPRYGLAVNSTASATGEVYLFGGLVRDMVKNDLYTLRVDRSSGSTNTAKAGISAELVQTTGEIPPPRVGHATVLVSNVLILWGGDTKVRAEDVHDAGLYLLNLNTREWTRVKAGTELTASASSSTTASVANPMSPGGTPSGPCGRYGHSVSIIASRLYVFGGQVDGAFLNDFWCFDLNSLKSTPSWELVRPANDVAPPRRTGHVSVTYKDCIYIFGGTDGQYHYNDTWCYSVTRNEWTELSCIGYIPVPREGHSACLVDDVMYVFGGRGVDGKDLGDLASFKITNKRWYMFANMGPSPSGRSGHALICFQSKVVVLGGESFTGNKGDEPGFVHVLDTGKIKYPTDATKGAAPPTGAPGSATKGAAPGAPGAGPAPGPADAVRTKSPEQRGTAPLNLTNGMAQQQQQQPQGVSVPAQARQVPNTMGGMPQTGPGGPVGGPPSGVMSPPNAVMSPPPQALNPAAVAAAAAAGSPTSVASGSQQQHNMQGAYGKMASGIGQGPQSQQQGARGPGSSPAQPYIPNAAAVRLDEAAAARSMSPTQRTIQEQRIAALNVSAAGPTSTAVASAALMQQQQRAVSPPDLNNPQGGGGQQLLAGSVGGYRAGPASQRSLENLRGQAASPPMGGAGPGGSLGRTGGVGGQAQGLRGINGTLESAGALGDAYSDGTVPTNQAGVQPYVIGNSIQSGQGAPGLNATGLTNGPASLAGGSPSQFYEPALNGLGGGPTENGSSGELAALRKREAWMKVALAAALRRGFVPSDAVSGPAASSKNVSAPTADELAAIEGMSGQFGSDGGEKDKVVKALLALKAKLAAAQATIAENAQRESERVAEVERMRAAAIQETSYFRSKVQAYEQNSVGEASRLDWERCMQLEKQVATALREQADLERKFASLTEQAKLEQQLRVSAEERLSESAKRAMAAEAAQMKAYDELSAAQKRSLAAESSLRDHQSQLTALRSTVARHQSDYEAARTNLSDANANIESHLSALTQVHAALDAATARAAEHERLYQTHREAADQNQSQILKLRTELETKNGEIGLLSGRLAELQSLVERTRAEAESHRNAASGALAQIIALHQERNGRPDAPVPRHVEDKLRALEDEAETLRQLHMQSRTAADSGTATLNEARERNLALEKQYSSHRTEMNALKSQLTNALQEISQMREHVHGWDAEAREARRNAEALQVKMSVLRQYANEAGLRLPPDEVLGGPSGTEPFYHPARGGQPF